MRVQKVHGDSSLAMIMLSALNKLTHNIKGLG